MKIEDLIKQLPPFGDKEKTVDDALISYGSWVTLDSEAKNYLTAKNKEEINTIIREILKAYKYFQIGLIAECYKTIYDIIFSTSYTCTLSYKYRVEDDSFFFRMRESDNDFLFSKEELFHIPFQNRQRTANQRFSLTGYPCLYIGKSIYVCWEELNRPKIDNANIVGLKNIRPVSLLDLRMPSNVQEVADFYRIPLIIASCVKVQEPNLPFKPEYIISQAILHAIVAHNNSTSSPDNFNGIIYYSSTVNNNQRLFDDLELFENIIVPTVNNTKVVNAEKIYESGFCPVLCNTFEITDPVSFNIYQLRKDVKTTFLYGEANEDKRYARTQMAVLEEYLKRLNTHKIEPNDFFRSRPYLLQQY